MNGMSGLGLSGWLLLGIASAIGPCAAHHALVMLPFIGMAKRNAREGLKEALLYSVARISGYALVGAVSGLLGAGFNALLSGSVLRELVQGILGAFLVVLAVGTVALEQTTICRILNRLVTGRTGRALALAGVLTALMPCPFLLGLSAWAAASGRLEVGAAAGGLFGIGTTLSPVLLAGPLVGFLRSRPRPRWLSAGFRIAGGLILFGYGVYLLVSLF